MDHNNYDSVHAFQRVIFHHCAWTWHSLLASAVPEIWLVTTTI